MPTRTTELRARILNVRKHYRAEKRAGHTAMMLALQIMHDSLMRELREEMAK